MDLQCSSTVAVIGTIMMKWNLVPSRFRTARTVLIHKQGDSRDVSNFRPISVCSMLRIIIERIIQKQLEHFISLNENQRAFTRKPVQTEFKLIQPLWEDVSKNLRKKNEL